MSAPRNRAAAIVLALALVAAACGGSDEPTADSGDADPGTSAAAETDSAPGDDATGDDAAEGEGADEPAVTADGPTLRIGLEAEPASLNPTKGALAPSGRVIGQAVFDTLVAFDDNENWVPNLSESWTPNADLTSWDMKLRDGIVFSDGAAMNADAVLDNWSRQLRDPLVGQIVKPAFDAETPFEKVDELTVRVNANGPNALIPAYFASQLGMIASPTWLEAADGDANLAQFPVGAGPFMIESRDQDLMTRLVRNPTWYGAADVAVGAVEFFPIQQESARTDQLLAGDLDMIHATDAGNILRLRDESDFGRIEDEGGQEQVLVMNARSAPFNDARVREAATLAFPEAQFEEFIRQGAYSAASSLWAPPSKWHVPEIEQRVDSPDDAVPLVNAYCADNPLWCTDGRVDITLQYPGPSIALEEIATVLTAGYDGIFNVSTNVVPQDQHIQTVALGLHQIALWRQHGNPDPELESIYLSCAAIGAISVNFSRNCNEERDALLTAQRAAVDETERIAIWREIQQDLRNSFHYVILSHTNWMIASAPEVSGVCDATTPDGVRILCTTEGTWRLPAITL